MGTKIETTKELKEFVKTNRINITNINDVAFTELYPILEVSSNYATYYDVKSQSTKVINAPFNINLK